MKPRPCNSDDRTLPAYTGGFISVDATLIWTEMAFLVFIHALMIPRLDDTASSADYSAMAEERFILAIDGGGMRGIIPAYILSRLSAMLKAEGDTRPLYSHFDLAAGTSTGALIAGALSIPVEGTGFKKEDGEEAEIHGEYTYRRFFRKKTEKYLKGVIERSADPDEFASLYAEHGSEIFPIHSVKSILGPLFTDKYEAKPYEAFLRKMYGDKQMQDLMIPTAFITYSTKDGMIYPVTSWNDKTAYIWEGARASSAAPLYFQPYNFYGRSLIDGGVAANNPSLIAYALARQLYPNARKYHILSLSTAEQIFLYEPEDSLGGLTGWANPLTKIFRDAALRTADYAMAEISDVSYTRIWIPESGRRIKLDETSNETINILFSTAEKLYEEKKDEIREFARKLASEPTHDSVRLREPKTLSL